MLDLRVRAVEAQAYRRQICELPEEDFCATARGQFRTVWYTRCGPVNEFTIRYVADPAEDILCPEAVRDLIAAFHAARDELAGVNEPPD